jgi:phosphoglycolate phosphatase-like HAD superfamily hydrolase
MLTGVGDSGLVMDFDGTILDTEEPVYRSWAELWFEHGYELSLADWQAMIGTEATFDPWAELQRCNSAAALAGTSSRPGTPSGPGCATGWWRRRERAYPSASRRPPPRSGWKRT